MRKALLIGIAGLSLAVGSTAAMAGSLEGAAIGAGTGAVVAGPVGAVAGGLIGATVGGPNFFGRRHYYRARHSYAYHGCTIDRRGYRHCN